MNQTAHISLQILSISKSVETKETEMRPVLLARPASFTSDFLLRLVAVLCLSGPSGVPFMHRCVSGEALFTVSVPNLQPPFLLCFPKVMPEVTFAPNFRRSRRISWGKISDLKRPMVHRRCLYEALRRDIGQCRVGFAPVMALAAPLH